MKSDRNSVIYIACFLGTAAVLFGVAIGLSLFFKPLSGDLTRIGRWSERDFGPTRVQSPPAIRANGPLLTDQQILVLGDSFSHPNIWQSYLYESTKSDTLSFEFKDVGCIDNWVNWVVSQTALASKEVIIEIAERSFVPVFRNDRVCISGVPVASKATDKMPSAGLMQGISLDAIYLLQTTGNTLRMRWQAGRINSGEVVNVPLASPDLFSNRKAKRLLYYAEDDNKKSWTQQDITMAIETLKKIQNRLGKFRLVVVVVPDKSTVYRPFVLGASDQSGYPDVFSALATSGVNSVDLLNLFREKVTTNIDLYLPNDTHLGPDGYRLMGAAIAERLQSTGTR